MAFQTFTNIEIDNFTHKLLSSYADGEVRAGTGFIVDYSGTSWLFTCWHNVEKLVLGQLTMTGQVMAQAITFVGDAAVTLDLRARRIVGCRVNDSHADIIAIELFPEEKPKPPYFCANADMSLKGVNFPAYFTIGGTSGGEGLNVPILKHYLWQGFPGADLSAPPESKRAFDFIGSTSQYPWMLRYAPGGYPGSSGCPIIELNEEMQAMRIAGVHVHHARVLNQQLHGYSTVDGSPKIAISEFEWGAAVPVELLYVAIDSAAPTGVSIAELRVGP